MLRYAHNSLQSSYVPSLLELSPLGCSGHSPDLLTSGRHAVYMPRSLQHIYCRCPSRSHDTRVQRAAISAQYPCQTTTREKQHSHSHRAPPGPGAHAYAALICKPQDLIQSTNEWFENKALVGDAMQWNQPQSASGTPAKPNKTREMMNAMHAAPGRRFSTSAKRGCTT